MSFMISKKSRKPDHPKTSAIIAIYIVLIVMILLCVVPFLMLLSASFSNEQIVTLEGVGFLPKGFTFTAYKQLIKYPEDIINAYAINIYTLIIGTVLNIFLTTLTAYPLSKADYKYRGITSFYLFFTVLFSGGMIPTYILLKQYLGLYDNLWVYIIPACVAPSNVFLLRIFMQNTPQALFEAAEIDGASEFRSFMSIAIPLAIPGILTVTFFIALAYWNDSTTGIYFISSSELVNLPLFLNRYTGYVQDMKSSMIASGTPELLDTIPENTMIYAITVVTSLPMLLVFMKFQKYYVQGMTAGAVKE